MRLFSPLYRRAMVWSPWGGARMEAALHHHVDRLGWATVALLALVVLASR